MTPNTPNYGDGFHRDFTNPERDRELNEAMELIKQKLFENMGRQDIRIVMGAIQHREKILTLIK